MNHPHPETARPRESRSVVAYAGREVVVEVGRVVDALGPQRVALQVQRLGAVRLRDAGVADQHVSYPVSDSLFCRRQAKAHGTETRLPLRSIGTCLPHQLHHGRWRQIQLARDGADPLAFIQDQRDGPDPELLTELSSRASSSCA